MLIMTTASNINKAGFHVNDVLLHAIHSLSHLFWARSAILRRSCCRSSSLNAALSGNQCRFKLWCAYDSRRNTMTQWLWSVNAHDRASAFVSGHVTDHTLRTSLPGWWVHVQRTQSWQQLGNVAAGQNMWHAKTAGITCKLSADTQVVGIGTYSSRHTSERKMPSTLTMEELVTATTPCILTEIMAQDTDAMRACATSNYSMTVLS